MSDDDIKPLGLTPVSSKKPVELKPFVKKETQTPVAKVDVPMSNEVDFDNFDDLENKEESTEGSLEEPQVDVSPPPKAGRPPKTIVVENKETKILTSEYSAKDFTLEEKKAAEDLHQDFAAYLTKTGGIAPEENIKSTIPTGIDVLDAILGGGVATKLVQFVGMPGAGKSALVSRIIATGQRKWPGKFISLYIDSEQSMSTERLSQLGVNMPEIVPYSEDITVEKVFKCVESICTYKEEHPEYLDIPSCVVWDSVANTLTDKGIEEDKHTSVLGQKAALLSHLLPKYCNKLNKYAISLVCVNQLREKIDMGGYTASPATLRFLADKNIPGGNSLLYNSAQLFYFRQRDIMKGEYGFDGVTVSGKAVKNKLFTPNIEIELVFSFEHGFSNFWTNYNLLKKYKRISVGGGWVKMDGYNGAKFNQSATIKKYREDPSFKEAWDNNVADVIQKEFIEPHQKGNSQQSDEW